MLRFRLFLFFLVISWSYSAENFALDLLDKTSGVEYIGTGYAGTARPRSIYAPYWNPAGLTAFDRPEIGINYYQNLNYVNHISIDSLILYKNTTPVAFNFVQEEIPDIPRTTDLAGEGTKIGTFSDTYRFYNISSAVQIGPGLFAGANLKLATRDLYSYSASGYGLDLGFLQKVNKNTQLGLNLKNLFSGLSWSTGTQETLERKAVVGISAHDQILEKDVYVDLDYDIPLGGIISNAWYLGTEIWAIEDIMAFRLGTNSLKDLTFGLGFNYYDLKTDVAYIIKDTETKFDNILLFSTGFRFRLERLQEEPEKKSNLDQPILKSYSIQDGKVLIVLPENMVLAKFAVIDPNKDVKYYEPSESPSFNYTVSGDYQIFLQDTEEKVYKQRISL